uniref:Uncharacterized protein n=1 Tax=Rhizophora mucronata TaxID=61149 RepID=A0A2P2IRG9_RHIMU
MEISLSSYHYPVVHDMEFNSNNSHFIPRMEVNQNRIVHQI